MGMSFSALDQAKLLQSLNQQSPQLGQQLNPDGNSTKNINWDNEQNAFINRLLRQTQVNPSTQQMYMNQPAYPIQPSMFNAPIQYNWSAPAPMNLTGPTMPKAQAWTEFMPPNPNAPSKATPVEQSVIGTNSY